MAGHSSVSCLLCDRNSTWELCEASADATVGRSCFLFERFDERSLAHYGRVQGITSLQEAKALKDTTQGRAAFRADHGY